MREPDEPERIEEQPEQRPPLLRLLADLRRRRVFRTVAAYAVAAWVLIEVVDTVGPALDFPDGSTRFVIYAALLALPLVVALSWMYDVAPGARETEPPSGRPLLVALASVPLLVGGMAAVAGLFDEELDVEGARRLLSEANELASQRRYAEAFALVERAGRVLAGDSTLAALREEVSVAVTVRTEPAGATVRALPITAPDPDTSAARETWGTAPIVDRTVPRVDHLVVATLDGHRPVERLLAPSRAYVNRPDVGHVSPLELSLSLEPENAGVPPDMVRVPGGEYVITSPDMPTGLSATLDEFFIDRFEVTNEQYREFVAAGGYTKLEHWNEFPPGADPAELMADFVDRTGQPGPRGWSAGRYPEGEARYPVSGVSWYEAAAYAEFRGRALPTLHQWEKAARDGETTGYDGYVLPWGFVRGGEEVGHRSRSQATGPGPVDEHPFGISPYGAYAMAGNAKEWLANRYGDGRAATGGSWQDPLYLFSEVGEFDPKFASPALGFRTVWLDPDRRRVSRDQGLVTIEAPSTPGYEPVDSATYAALLSHYRYDAVPARAEIVETVEAADWDRQHVEFDGPAGERLSAYLYLPRRALPPYQPIVYVPSVDAFVSGAAAEAEAVLGPLIRRGRAVFVVVMKGMVGRENPPDYEPPPFSSVAFRDRMVLHATEMRLGIDYLETRDDIAIEDMAYVGLSFGAGSRLAFAAVDPRFRAVVLIGGGIDERMKPVLPEVDNVNFAPHIEAPTLMVHGRQDEEHPWLTRGRALWNLLREPKQLVLLEGEGHLPRSEALIPPIETLLDETIGPVSLPED